MEWFYRILQEPRRMWKRYAKTNLWIQILPGCTEFLPPKKLKLMAKNEDSQYCTQATVTERQMGGEPNQERLKSLEPIFNL